MKTPKKGYRAKIRGSSIFVWTLEKLPKNPKCANLFMQGPKFTKIVFFCKLKLTGELIKKLCNQKLSIALLSKRLVTQNFSLIPPKQRKIDKKKPTCHFLGRCPWIAIQLYQAELNLNRFCSPNNQNFRPLRNGGRQKSKSK